MLFICVTWLDNCSVSSRGLGTRSSIKREKSSFYICIFYYWIPWTSHGMTGSK
ncbi:MAG: hypothetical protein ACRYE8_01685 [Janthinobacterium lividum]